MLELDSLVAPRNGQNRDDLAAKDGPGLGAGIGGNDDPVALVLDIGIYGVGIHPETLGF